MFSAQPFLVPQCHSQPAIFRINGQTILRVIVPVIISVFVPFILGVKKQGMLKGTVTEISRITPPYQPYLLV